MTASLFAGIDLHSNNLMIGIVDQAGQRLKHQKLDCDLAQVVQFLKPFQPCFKSLAVESTYNWYWLVDGLRAHSFPVVLANPAQIEQYNGLKHADDKRTRTFWPNCSAWKPGRTTSITPMKPRASIAQRRASTRSLRMTTDITVMKSGIMKTSE